MRVNGVAVRPPKRPLPNNDWLGFDDRVFALCAQGGQNSIRHLRDDRGDGFRE